MAETDALLLAIAHEHGSVDFIGAWAELERLGAALRGRRPRGELEEQADALVALLADEGFRRASRVSPQDVLLDAVLRRREGHPLVLAATVAAVAARAGLRAVPLRSAEDFLVGLTDGEQALAIDPAGCCASAPRDARWLCPHEVAFHVLGELSELLALHGRVDEAIRAARLRLELPIPEGVRERVEVEARMLRARLN